MKILENYITAVCDRSDRPDNQNWYMNTKYIQTSCALIFCKAKWDSGLRIVAGLINKLYETCSGQCYSDCLEEEADGCKIQRLSYTQFRRKYCKK